MFELLGIALLGMLGTGGAAKVGLVNIDKDFDLGPVGSLHVEANQEKVQVGPVSIKLG